MPDIRGLARLLSESMRGNTITLHLSVSRIGRPTCRLDTYDYPGQGRSEVGSDPTPLIKPYQKEMIQSKPYQRVVIPSKPYQKVV